MKWSEAVTRPGTTHKGEDNPKMPTQHPTAVGHSARKPSGVLSPPPSSSPTPGDSVQVEALTDSSCHQLTVKLPSVSSTGTAEDLFHLSSHTKASATSPCKGLHCEFYGSPQYDSYCSKCYTNIVKNATRSEATSR